MRRSAADLLRTIAPARLPLATAVLLLCVAACSTTQQQKVPFTNLKYMNGHALPGTFHTVAKGDTLLAIAEQYECNIHVLATINDLQPGQALASGDRVFIPRMRGEFPTEYYAKPRNADADRAVAQAVPPVSPAVETASAPAPARSTVAAASTAPAPKAVAKAAPAPAPARTASKPAATTVASQSSSAKSAAPSPRMAARAAPASASASPSRRAVVIADSNAKPKPTISPIPAPEPVKYTYRSSTVPRFPFSGNSAKSIASAPSTVQSRGGAQLSRSRTTAAMSSAEISNSSARTTVPSRPRVAGAPPFLWPCQGNITGRFNAPRRDHMHKGLDIACPQGTPVRAAYHGKVIYSGNNVLPALGNMVLIEHTGGWVTVYAHNYKNLVREGERVEAGQTIALVGTTGRSTGPHLHFEIRQSGISPVNPEKYLP